MLYNLLARPRVLQLAAGSRLHPRSILRLHHARSLQSVSGKRFRQWPHVNMRTTMLQDAVNQHEKLQAEANSRSYMQQSTDVSINNAYIPPGHSQSSTKILNPLSASNVNAQRTRVTGLVPGHGLKRTSDGLAKAISASFEDENDEVQVTRVVKKNRAPEMAEVIDIAADDFGSDFEFDLDVEEPKTAVKYAQLPRPESQSVHKSSGGSNNIVYPTLPAQQPSNISEQQPSFGAISSSRPLEWSSSPINHLEPRQPTAASVHARQVITESKTALASASAPRRLPWALQQDDKHMAPATPAAKSVRRRDELWNNSASAIKTQLKEHRKESEVRRAATKDQSMKDVVIQTTKQSSKRPAKVFLSEEQQHVLNLVVEKKRSVFFTGSAGTGKSVLLRQIIADMRARYARETDRIAVTASTGLAACNIGGVTLHSFAGIGLGKEDVPELLKKIRRNAKAKQRWLRTKVLVIDEVSMVDAELFDKLENIARAMRNNGRPFGGIQLVITGDFFQLPPVDKSNAAKFCFDAGSWSTTVHHTILLHQVFRQKDPVFAGMLNEMREGRLSDSSIQAFKNLSREPTFEEGLSATELFPLRVEVEKANNDRLNRLQGDEVVFTARDGGAVHDKIARDKLLSNFMAPERIVLKKGAQVMLIKNVDELLVNGSIGQVLAFMTESESDEQARNRGLYHKPDEDDESKVLNDDMPREGTLAKRMYESASTAPKYPLVRFSVPDGTFRDLLCQPESWKVELPNGEIQASRSQIPLILSWALSIHKAQGQTLDRVKVDLGKVFEKGQAYVALSRATSMAGLQVLRFDHRKVVAHDRVRNFYSNLARVESTEPKAVEEAKSYNAASEYERRFQEEGNEDM